MRFSPLLLGLKPGLGTTTEKRWLELTGNNANNQNVCRMCKFASLFGKLTVVKLYLDIHCCIYLLPP